MLNFIWCIFIIFGIFSAFFTGTTAETATAILEGGQNAVRLAITMAGVVATWSGIMKIAEKGGLIESISEKLTPVMNFLFPDIPQNHPARQYIATNFTANFLGLGWAATPAGLLAMKELQKLNRHKETASRAMCMFLIVNMSSLQLVTVNLLAYRTQYGSANPSEIVGPGIIATLVSTLTGIAAGKLFAFLDRKD